MRIVPASNGAAWLARGFALFRRNPPVWLLLAFSYWLAATLLAQVPYAGRALLMVLLPPVTMTFLTLCAELEAGNPVRPRVLVDAFRARFRVLAGLGVLNLACLLLVLAALSLADGPTLASAFGARPPSPEEGSDPADARATLITSAASLPVMLAFWFATPLAGWGGMGALQSLFYSFFAALRNWRALLVYGAVLVLIGFVLLAVMGMIAAVTRRGDAASTFALVATLFLMPTALASSYASYRDVFPEGRAAPPVPG